MIARFVDSHFWPVLAVSAVLVLFVVYGAGWGLADCPRWFLRCTCRAPENLPGPASDSPAATIVRKSADASTSRAGEPVPAELEGVDPEDAAWLQQLGSINRQGRRLDPYLPDMTAEQVWAWLETEPLASADWIGREAVAV